MKKFLALLVIAAMTLTGVSAFAYDVKVDDDTFMKTGVKAQIRYVMANPDPFHDRLDVLGTQGRFYAAGQVTNMVKFGLNMDMARARVTSVSSATTDNRGTPSSTFSLSDAFIMLDVSKELKIMSGIYRMAVSRVALQDSYQYILVNAPEVAPSNLMSSGLAGYRGAGVTLWGDIADGMIRYNVGAWDGDHHPLLNDFDPATNGTQAFGRNLNDEIGLSGRLVINFMDPEKGYTCPGCYLGKAKVANVGVGYYTHDYSDLATADSYTYSIMTVDAFYDANGLNAEAGYFMYDDDQGIDGSKPSGWYVEGAYAMDKIQPAVRYESWDSDNIDEDYTKLSLGVNYLLAGHDAKIQLEYAMKDWDSALGGEDTDTVTLQLQAQF